LLTTPNEEGYKGRVSLVAPEMSLQDAAMLGASDSPELTL